MPRPHRVCSASAGALASSPLSSHFHMASRTSPRPSGGTNSVGDATGTEATVGLRADEVSAEAWDRFLQRFGAEVYVMARYISATRAKPMNAKGPDHSSS